MVAEVTDWVFSKVIGQGKEGIEELSAYQVHCVGGSNGLERGSGGAADHEDSYRP